MTSLVFTWADYWNFYDSLADQKLRDHLETEAIGQGWLYRQSAAVQLVVLDKAPEEFIKRIVKELKPALQIRFGVNPYQDYIDKWSR